MYEPDVMTPEAHQNDCSFSSLQKKKIGCLATSGYPGCRQAEETVVVRRLF